MTKLTTHVLDLVSGNPASGLRLDLYRIGESGDETLLCQNVTNEDGRIDEPLLTGKDLKSGTYRIDFHAGDYLREQARSSDFLDVIPVRFKISDPKRHYHVPLLLSSFGYSTYRGS